MYFCHIDVTKKIILVAEVDISIFFSLKLTLRLLQNITTAIPRLYIPGLQCISLGTNVRGNLLNAEGQALQFISVQNKSSLR